MQRTTLAVSLFYKMSLCTPLAIVVFFSFHRPTKNFFTGRFHWCSSLKHTHNAADAPRSILYSKYRNTTAARAFIPFAQCKLLAIHFELIVFLHFSLLLSSPPFAVCECVCSLSNNLNRKACSTTVLSIQHFLSYWRPICHTYRLCFVCGAKHKTHLPDSLLYTQAKHRYMV